MSGEIYTIKPKNNTVSFADFPERLHQSGLLNDFDFHQIPLPVYSFRQEFLDHIAKNGLSSLYNFTVVMEDITSPSMTINDIEQVIAKFLINLNGAKKLVIIDPYFYSKSKTTDISIVFKNLLSGISSDLEEIAFISNGRSTDTKNDIHSAVSSLDPGISIKDFSTDEFHDRYWIDPDNNIGIVMGTSLNGLGKKIALIDKLRSEDVEEIVKLAKTIGAPI
ncbi:hypothetical protein [Dickeya zeae]|uniref:hypothetical protein n=1 Tax=Dickeya zeae TaxID=204042 RepID=UPI00037C4AF1|nr:hypothetical protein [Dickeya zeae]UJR55307.1 hypothetical protein J417_15360 [Dickeya zeae MS1]